MTDELQKRFILLTALLEVGGHGTKSAVLDYIDRHGLINLSAADRSVMENRDEMVWRNNLAFVRKHLVDEGLMDGAIRNRWAITTAGTAYLRGLLRHVPPHSRFTKVTDVAIARARAQLHAGA